MTAKSVFGIITITLSLATCVHAQSWLTNGLVAYYPFNGNANDASGNGDNGIVHATVLTQDRLGRPNNAYYFNVTNASAILATGSMLPTGSNPRTFSFWAKPDEKLPQTNFVTSTILSYGDYSAGFQIYFNYEPLSNVLTLNANTLFASSPTRWGSWVRQWDFAEWYHLVVTIDTNSVLSMYVNGNPWQVSFPATNQGFNIPRAALSIGAFQSNHFDGSLDDIRIYNHALSASEVQQLYAYESGPRVTLLKAVKPSFSNLYLGTKYKLQVSDDLLTWYDQGPPFTATSTEMDYPEYYDVDFWNQLYFRLKVSP